MLDGGDSVVGEGNAVGVGERPACAAKLAPDVGAEQAYLSGGGEPLTAEHTFVDGKPLSVERRSVGVGELAACAAELAADVSAEQADLPAGGEALTAR